MVSSSIVCSLHATATTTVSAPIPRRQMSDFVLFSIRPARLSRGSRHSWHTLFVLIVNEYAFSPTFASRRVPSTLIVHSAIIFFLIVAHFYPGS